MRACRAALSLIVSTAACAPIQQQIAPPTIAQVAPQPLTPLATPTQTMKGGKGDADAPYPPDFGVVVKSDGTIVFPQRTTGKIKGPSLVVGGETVLTVNDDGQVKGVALKRHYRFDAEGALLDEEGHGVRIEPDGGVRGVGGDWRYKDVFAWTPDGGGKWDRSAWRTLEIVALVMLENMLPRAIRGQGDSAAATSTGKSPKDKGLTIEIPPPSEWFKGLQ